MRPDDRLRVWIAATRTGAGGAGSAAELDPPETYRTPEPEPSKKTLASESRRADAELGAEGVIEIR